MFGFIGDSINNLAGNMFADERQEDAQQFNSGEAALKRQWDERMRATQYQTTVKDMQKAGLNPMLAYHQGGAGTPSGASATSSPAGAPHNTPPSVSMANASQIRVNDAIEERTRAEAEKVRAEKGEIEARTPTHAWSIEKIKQEIGESAVRIENIWQQTKTGASSAQLMDQQVKNLQAEIPRIRATVDNLKAQTTREGATTSEINQRVKENLPRLEAAARALENKVKEIQQPGHYQAADVRGSFTGLLGEYLRALNPLRQFMESAK